MEQGTNQDSSVTTVTRLSQEWLVRLTRSLLLRLPRLKEILIEFANLKFNLTPENYIEYA